MADRIVIERASNGYVIYVQGAPGSFTPPDETVVATSWAGLLRAVKVLFVQRLVTR